jgi:micrococcal nuclease
VNLRLSCAVFLSLSGCGDAPEPRCGPSEAVVRHVIDGDTVELSSGERVRYLLVDTPETTGDTPECFGPEARARNRTLVEGRRISLRYDAECTDRYGRLLAYVSVGTTDVNARLVADGYACVLHIPPNGASRVREFKALQNTAAAGPVGIWAECGEDACN